MIDSQKHSDLTKDIMEWLLDNRNLPVELCVGVVKAKLSKANLDTETLLHYAAYSFIAVDDVSTFRAEGINKLSELIPLVQTISAESVELGESKIKKELGVSANAGRVEKFSVLKGKLKDYWQKNISPTSKPSAAARKLLSSEVFKDPETKLEDRTLRGYVTEWQKELQEVQK